MYIKRSMQQSSSFFGNLEDRFVFYSLQSWQFAGRPSSTSKEDGGSRNILHPSHLEHIWENCKHFQRITWASPKLAPSRALWELIELSTDLNVLTNQVPQKKTFWQSAIPAMHGILLAKMSLRMMMQQTAVNRTFWDPKPASNEGPSKAIAGIDDASR